MFAIIKFKISWNSDNYKDVDGREAQDLHLTLICGRLRPPGMLWRSKVIPTKVVINHPSPSPFDPTHSPRHLAITARLWQMNQVTKVMCQESASLVWVLFRDTSGPHIQRVSSHHVLHVAMWHVLDLKQRTEPNGLFIFHKSAFYGGVVSERDKILNGFPGMWSSQGLKQILVDTFRDLFKSDPVNLNLPAVLFPVAKIEIVWWNCQERQKTENLY